MNCAKCPHQSEINAALRPCQICDKACFHGGASRADVLNGGKSCGDCPHLKEIQKATRWCDACDAGRLGGTCHIDAGGRAEFALQHALPNVHCTVSGVTNLSPDVEDDLRKALSFVFQMIDYKTAPVLLAVLKGGRFFRFIRIMRMSKRDFVEAAHRAREILSGAERFLSTDESKAAAQKIVSEMCKLNALKDAVTVLALFRRDNGSVFARKAGLNSRQTANARVASLVGRFPFFLPMHTLNVSLDKHLPLADGWRSSDAVKPRTMDKRMMTGFF